MEKKITLVARRAKRMGGALRNFPIFALCAVVSISVELFAWGAILTENVATVTILGQTVRLAFAEVAISTSFSLAALVLAASAAAFKADPRSDQRRRAFGAQFLAVCVLGAPVYYAGNALAYQSQLASWRAYSGSEAESADRGLANGESPDGLGVDSQVRAEAARRLRQGIRPERAEFDPLATLWVGLILGANMLAVRLGWRARPETPAEAKARVAALRAAKAKFTRERNKRARQDDDTNVAPFTRRA
jgi:hypothetical protein